MIIAQISDTHIALDTEDADRRIADFEATIADINALDPPPDLIVHSGDIVQNGRLDEYRCAAEILSRANAPVYLMVGNKDDRDHLRQTFPSATYLNTDDGFIAYSIEDFPVRLVMLDTLKPGDNKGTLCQLRLDRMTEMIAADTDKPVAVFAHHPPFLVQEGPEPLHFESAEVMQKFRDALMAAPHLTNVYCGHVHRGVAGHVGNIPVLVMTCIATPLRRGDYPAEMRSRPVYHLHRYEQAWGFTSELRIVDGA